MQCEQCGSEHTQRLEIVYDEGTSSIHTRSRTAGFGFADRGLGLGGASTTTSGTSRSRLASRAAPPGKRGYGFPVIVGFLASIVFSAADYFTVWNVAAGLTMAACAVLLVTAVKFNFAIHPRLLHAWRNRWLCHKCGLIYDFVPSPER